MIFCKYKDIFGVPGEGVHKKRIFGMAAVDLIGTILLSIILAYLLKKNVLLVFLIVFIIGEILHYLFCVETAFLKFLKLNM